MVGEEIITPEAIVTFAVKVRIDLPGTATASTSGPASPASPLDNVVGHDKEDLFKEDDFALDLDAESLSQDSKKGPSAAAAAAAAAAQLGQPAHAPFYPHEKRPVYWVVLANTRSNRNVTAPVRITDFLEKGKTTAEKVIRMQFQAPAVGKYQLALFVVCDSWSGTDTLKEIKLNVEPASRITQVESDDDISEDEGSFGAMMREARGQLEAKQAKKKQVRKRPAATAKANDGGKPAATKAAPTAAKGKAKVSDSEVTDSDSDVSSDSDSDSE